MPDKVVNRRISIFIDQDSALSAQARLQAAFDKSKAKVEALENAGKDATAEIAKMSQLKDRLAEMDGIIAGKLNPSFNMVKKTVADLRKELQSMSQDAPGYAAKFQRFQEVNAQFTEMKKNLGGVHQAMQSLASQVKTIALGVLVGNTIQSAIQQVGSYISGIVQGNARLSDSMADIRRVTGLTDAQVKELYSSLRQIDTRTSTSGLLNIAVIAGKLGIDGVRDLASFTAATDKLQVALGDELGDADQITTQLGKILNVFGNGTKITGDALLHVGNAVVDLANKGVATGGFIVDFTQRLSGLAQTAKLSLPDVLGLAAGLEETGQRTEQSSTAVIKVMTRIASDVPAAAKIAGKSIEDFTNTLNTKPLEALLEFATGLQKNKDGFAQVAAAFKDAGEDGSRIIATLGVLGGKADFFRQKMAEAGVAIKGTDEIMAAFNLKNETLAGQLDKLGKQFYNLITSSTIKDFLTSLISLTGKFLTVLSSLGGFIKDNILALGLWTAAIILNQTARINNIKSIIAQRVAALANKLAIEAEIVATTALSAIQALLAGNIAKARQEFKLLTVAMGTDPLGAVLIAAGALVVAFNEIIKKTNELNSAERVHIDIQKKVADATAERISKVQTLINVINDNKIALDTRKQALQELINISPQYLSGLNLENAATADGKRLIDEYIASLKEKAQEEAAAQLRTEKLKEQLQLQLDIQKAQKTLPGVGGAIVFSIPTQLGIGPFATLDKLQEKLKQVNEDIKTLDDQTTKQIESTSAKAQNSVSATSKNTIGKLIESLKTQIATLEAAYEELNVNDKKGIADNIARRKQLQAQLDALEGKRVAGRKKANNSIEEGAKKLYQDLHDLAAGNTSFHITEFEKELGAAYKRYNDLESRAEKYIKNEKTRAMILAQIEEMKQKDIASIAQKYIDKAQKKVKEPGAPTDPISSKETQKQIEQFSKSLINGVHNVAAILNSDLEKAQLEAMRTSGAKRLEAEYKLLDAEKNKELFNKKLTEEGKQAIEEKYRELRKQAEEAYIVNSLQTFLDFAQQASQIFSSLAEIQTNKENQELANDKRVHDTKVANLENEYSKKLITRQQHDQQIAALDAAYDKRQADIQKKQFERSKRMQIIQAIMSGAQAIVSTLAAIPGPLDIASLGAARIIQIALITATTAAQIAAISSQKPPSYGEGGMLNGPKHSSRFGGMPVINPATGRVNAMMEGGEGVLKASAMSSSKRYTVSGTPSQIASSLNSLHGGIAWNSGATLTPSWMNGPQPQMNIPNILKSFQTVRMFASGGVFQPGQQPTANSQQTTIVQAGFSDEQLKLLIAALDKKTKAYVVLQDIIDQQTRLNNIQSSATLRG